MQPLVCQKDHLVKLNETQMRVDLSEGLGFDSACPPGFRTQLHVTNSLRTDRAEEALWVMCSCLRGFPGGLPPWLVVPVLRSCQSLIWIWLVNYLHLHLLLHSMIWTMLSDQLFRVLHLPCVGAMPHICTQSLRGANSQWRYSACIFSLQTQHNPA